MVSRMRHRSVGGIVTTGGRIDYYNDGAYWFGANHISHVFPRDRREVTSDELHVWPIKKGNTRDEGGPFQSVKASLRADWKLDKVYTLGKISTGAVYTGHIVPQMTPFEWGYLLPTNDPATMLHDADPHPVGYLDAQGANAIANTIPTNPHADAAVGLAELFREGFPALIGSTLFKNKIASFRELGSEYLNFEFGWKPFVSDILDIAQSISDSEELLQQLARDSGKNVRRRFSFPAERSIEYTEDGYYLDSGANSSLLSQRGRSVSKQSYERSWFSGCYTYHYDPADLNEASRIATQARYLLGVRIDPEVLWNLAPWSWLVDWFVNLGPVLHNLSAFQQDGLVLRYGYLMHHSVKRTNHLYRGVVTPYGGNFPTGDRSSCFTLESKTRIRATPYGFGITLSSLTARQFAILGALGITRL